MALELSYLNSNLQLLKEQLSDLNSSMELYQMENTTRELLMPMIPLGLKETKEIEMTEMFRDFILEHYSEDGCQYEDQLVELMDLRRAMRTPTRDTNGISLLFEYYNQLYFLERRFFPPDRSLGIYFEWYDSLTGVPSSQRTVAFEKASVLFNIGGLFTQIGTKQDRVTEEGLDTAVDNFLRAAGTFQYIHENFTNAPSSDLGPDTLHMLVQLMCGQARECLFEKTELSYYQESQHNIDLCLELGQEAAHVSEVYEKVEEAINHPPVKEFLPFTWVSLVQVKREYYRALSHYYVGLGLVDQGYLHLQAGTRQTLLELQDLSRTTRSGPASLPETRDQRVRLGKAHLREALLLHEEALRMLRMCRDLRKKDGLADVLRQSHDRCAEKYADVDDEDDFSEVMEPPPVLAGTTYQLSLAFPDFSRHKVVDLFRSLGPVAVFSAKHHWTAPRTVQLRKKEDEGFGFSVRGDAPVVIAGVEHGSLADVSYSSSSSSFCQLSYISIIQIGGMREGDYLVTIRDQDVKWSSHASVVKLIRDSGNKLRLQIVSPLDKSLIKIHERKVRSLCHDLTSKYLLITFKSSTNPMSSYISSPSSTASSTSGLSIATSQPSSEFDSLSSPASDSSSSKKSWPRLFRQK